MNLSRLVLPAVMAGILFFSNPVWARNAQILMAPTRVVLESGTRYTTVTVRNSGDGVGRYKVDLVDATMNENGGIKVNPDGVKDEFSAHDMISFSPRSMTINPDENQDLRILVKMPRDLPDGEYRTHLQVKVTEGNLDPATGKRSTEGASIVMQPRMAAVIPLIIRKGQTSFNVKIDDAKLQMGGGDGKQIPEVHVSMSYSGNRSVLGDFKVTHVAPDGKETQLAFDRGIAIYRGLTKRSQTVPLTVPDGVNIRAGKLRVAFLSQEKEGSHVLSEKDVTP
ncbi:MAG: hypothetical protein PHY92_04625 [Alphaproteobacteria bacterium]|nr:hypothetical protein [Alphaproteobacteria bacterium]